MKWVADEMPELGEVNAELLRSLATYLEEQIAQWQQLNQQANELYHQGKFDNAVIFAEQALALALSLYHGDHPDVTDSLNNLAALLTVTHRPAEALELMREAAEVEDRIISRVFAASSDRDRLHHLQTIRHNFDFLLSLVWQYFPDSPAAVQIALDVTLRRKSLTASALATFNYALYSDRYPKLAPEFEQWRTLRAKIVHLIFSPPLPNPNLTSAEIQAQQATHKQTLSDLESKCDNSQSPSILLLATHGYFAQEKQQAYRNLIGQLLNCPNGEEREILLAHPHLLDQHLLAMMEKLAINL